jgi:ATP-dependent helicase HrpA
MSEQSNKRLPASPPPSSPASTDSPANPRPQRAPQPEGQRPAGQARPQQTPRAPQTPRPERAPREAFRTPLPPITFPEDLPVSGRRNDIAKALTENQVIIVSGETGSGKTTQLPKICLELGRGSSCFR